MATGFLLDFASSLLLEQFSSACNARLARFDELARERRVLLVAQLWIKVAAVDLALQLQLLLLVISHGALDRKDNI